MLIQPFGFWHKKKEGLNVPKQNLTAMHSSRKRESKNCGILSTRSTAIRMNIEEPQNKYNDQNKGAWCSFTFLFNFVTHLPL